MKVAPVKKKKNNPLIGDKQEYNMMRMDGYNDCQCGIVYRFGMPPIVCYDLSKVISKLQADGMTREEAVEFWEFNQLGAWVGEETPCFLEKI